MDEPSLEEKLDIILEHYTDMLEYYGKLPGVKIARKHLSWYTAGMSNSTYLRSKINIVTDPNEVISLIKEFFSMNYESCYN